MKHYMLVFGLLIFNTILNVENAEYLTGRDFKTSIIIPCCAKHAVHLYELLKWYENQTELPDEIVISLSESNQVQSCIFEPLQKTLWKFPVRLILSEEKLFAGENRNIACEHAIGDLLICQDADDVPYPQRVQIIKYFFKKYKIDHLMHQWSTLDQNGSLPFEHRGSVRLYKLSRIRFFYPKTSHEPFSSGPYTNGNVAIARYVFNAVKWSAKPRGQDTLFNENVYAYFKNCIAIKVPLLVYRSFLSSIRTETNQPNTSQFYALTTIIRS